MRKDSRVSVPREEGPKKLNQLKMGFGVRFLRSEFAEESVGADVASVVLEGGAIGQAGKKITDCPTHPLLLDA